MRSSRASQTIRIGLRKAYIQTQALQRHQRYEYCSVCDPPAPSNGPTIKTFPSKRPKDSWKPPKEVKPPPDHRTLGVQQELFTTSIYSPGSAIFLPNGTKIFNRLTNFLRSQYENYGFQEVISPTIYKKSLWEKSGHWENYAEEMYSVTGRGAEGKKEDGQVGGDEEYGLKPMNCPGHCLIFASKKRSYRDLPIRYADFSPLHRNELTGALSGLTRGRRFHQDDGHIFCRPIQIKEEILKTLDFVRQAYGVLNLGTYRMVLSTRPKGHFIGTVEEWDNAERALTESLNASGKAWTLNEGDGAFYGPKIDIILKDSDGKEHQTATIQLDFQLPKRFELEYSAPAPEMEQKGIETTDEGLLAVEGTATPVMIHRAVLGSVERIMALMIERYNGAWPFWLNPNQIAILTLNDTQALVEYTARAKRVLQMSIRKPQTSAFPLTKLYPVNGLSVDIDTSARSLSRKIKDAKEKGYGVVVVIGKEDMEISMMSVDLSGLPKTRYDIANHPMLQNHFAKQATLAAQMAGAEQIPSQRMADSVPIEPEVITNIANEPAEAPTITDSQHTNELSTENGKLKKHGSNPRKINQQISHRQLKNIRLSAASLRDILLDIRSGYM